MTGSTDTSDDSYLMQMGRILRTASPRKADMYGVVPHPMFLGYHPANRMSRLSNFLQQSTLGLSRDQQNALRASYLQSMLDKTYELQGIPPEERLPVLMGGPERVDLPMMEDYGSIRPNQVVLPQFGVMKLPVDWTGKRRPKLREGGPYETDPVKPSKGKSRFEKYLTDDATVEGNPYFANLPDQSGLTDEQRAMIDSDEFRGSPENFRGQVPREFWKTQQRAGKALHHTIGRPGYEGKPTWGKIDWRKNQKLHKQDQYQDRQKAEAAGVPSEYINDYGSEQKPPGTGSRKPMHGDHNFTTLGKFAYNIKPWHWGDPVRSKPTKFASWSGYRSGLNKYGGNIEAELSQKAIDDLVKQGYIVEDV